MISPRRAALTSNLKTCRSQSLACSLNLLIDARTQDWPLPCSEPVSSSVTHLRVMKPWNQMGAAPCCRSSWAWVFWNQARVSACRIRASSLGTSSFPTSFGLQAAPGAWRGACIREGFKEGRSSHDSKSAAASLSLHLLALRLVEKAPCPRSSCLF